MNEINNQSLRPVTVRASSVSAKPDGVAKVATKNAKKNNDAVVAGGKTLPVNAKPLPRIDSRKQQLNATVGSAAAAEVSQANESIEAAVAKMNEYTQSMQRDIRFSLHEASGRTVVTVVDRQSQEVIRQIPDEAFLKMARNLNDYIEAHVETRRDQRAGRYEDGVLHLISARV